MAYPSTSIFAQTGNYQYPLDLGSIGEQHYMIFTIKEDKPYIRKIPKTKSKADKSGQSANKNPSSIRVTKTETIDSIALYIPKNGLKTAYNAEWGDVELGVFGAIAMDEVAKAAEDMQAFQEAEGEGPDSPTATYAAALGGSISRLTDQFKQGVDSSAAKQAMLASQTGIGKSVLGKLGGVDTAAAALSLGTRLAINPHLKTIFKGVNKFREHSFDFEFYPKNPDESEAVQHIVTTFKKSMLPSTEGFEKIKSKSETIKDVNASADLQGVGGKGTGAKKQTTPKHTGKSYFFKYPRDFTIDFFMANTDTPLYQIGRSVLTQMTLDYGSSGGIPVFFKGTDAPAEIRLSLSFKETELLTREYIVEGY